MRHKFRIIFTDKTGAEQSFTVEGSSIQDVKRSADAAVVAKGGVDWRSERLSGDEA